jgi:FkbM family methyltransferase
MRDRTRLARFTKRAARHLLDRMNVSISRSPPAARFAFRLARTCDVFQIATILDVGANRGQFGIEMRQAGYTGRIVSFEPLSSAHLLLSAVAANDPDWIVHPRCAIGDRDGLTTINVARNSLSSSLLPMTEAHVQAEPLARYAALEETEVCRLSSVANAYMTAPGQTLLKIDTQGYEWQVLDGAAELLPRVTAVLAEASFVELYEGSRLWRDLIDRLEESGFSLWSIHPEFNDPLTGQTLQCDVLLVRVSEGGEATRAEGAAEWAG